MPGTSPGRDRCSIFAIMDQIFLYMSVMPDSLKLSRTVSVVFGVIVMPNSMGRLSLLHPSVNANGEVLRLQQWRFFFVRHDGWGFETRGACSIYGTDGRNDSC